MPAAGEAAGWRQRSGQRCPGAEAACASRQEWRCGLGKAFHDRTGLLRATGLSVVPSPSLLRRRTGDGLARDIGDRHRRCRRCPRCQGRRRMRVLSSAAAWSFPTGAGLIDKRLRRNVVSSPAVGAAGHAREGGCVPVEGHVVAGMLPHRMRLENRPGWGFRYRRAVLRGGNGHGAGRWQPGDGGCSEADSAVPRLIAGRPPAGECHCRSVAAGCFLSARSVGRASRAGSGRNRLPPRPSREGRRPSGHCRSVLCPAASSAPAAFSCRVPLRPFVRRRHS